MVGVRRLSVIIGMAAITGIGGVGVIPVMAGSAIVRNVSMCPVQSIEIVVNVKPGGYPARVCGMAGGTIRWQPQFLVVGVGGFIIIRRMAGFTLSGGALIAVGVALNAFRFQVAACQGEICTVVVEGVVRIPKRMAGQAGQVVISITIHSGVLFICLRVGMAVGARELGIVRRIVVAIRTLRPLTGMGAAVYREKAVVLGEISRHPPHIGGVALRTGRRNIRTLVIGVGSIFIIRLMAGNAIRRSIGEITSCMALGAV